MQLNTFFKRTFTGVIFVSIVLFLVLFNDLTLHIFLWIIALLSGIEFLRIRLDSKFNSSFLWLIGIIALALLPVLNYLNIFTFHPVLPLVIISVLYHAYLAGRLFFNYSYGSGPINIVFTSFLYIGLPILLLNQTILSGGNKELILNIILLLWASDTFAYLVGTLFGKHKLMPKVSPGKTIEGAVGGLVFTLITAVIMYKYLPLGSIYYHLVFGFIIWFFGLLGDLVESHLKRQYNIKDSGSLLPGHGGFLDRFDSFIFVIPFILLYTLIF